MPREWFRERFRKPWEDSTENGFRLALFLATLVLSSLIFELFPADTLEASLVQSLALAVLTLAAVACSDMRVLGIRPKHSDDTERPAGGFFSSCAGRLYGWAGYLLAVGLIAGVLAVFLTASSADAVCANGPSLLHTPLQLAGRTVLIAAICFGTGVFEEGLFRVLAFNALRPACGQGSRGVVLASVVSSALFALMHVSIGDALAADSAIVWLQLLFKFAQAMLFGFFMAALFVRVRNVWMVAGVHALFDLFYLGPSAILSGMLQSTYLTGSVPDLALLVGTVALFVPLAVVAYRSLSSS